MTVSDKPAGAPSRNGDTPSPNNNNSNNTPSSTPFPGVSPTHQPDLTLVHRVLLADKAERLTLTATGQPEQQRTRYTPSFEEFDQALNSAPNVFPTQRPDALTFHTESMEVALRPTRVLRDQLCNIMLRGAEESSSSSDVDNNTGDGPPIAHSLEPLDALISELYVRIQALVPSRSDLHSRWKRKSFDKSDHSRDEVVKVFHDDVLIAAQGLAQLESEARSETTLRWIRTSTALRARGRPDPHGQETIPIQSNLVRFLVTSTLYLIWKTDLCVSDMRDFYFKTLLVPRLVKSGPDLEREAFVRRFGPFPTSSDSSPAVHQDETTTTSPATKRWLMESVRPRWRDREQKAQQQHLDGVPAIPNPSSRDHRHQALREAWVQDLLFRSSDLRPQEPLLLPEIFHLDQTRFHHIRQTTRMAVAGSVLTWHAAGSEAPGQQHQQLLEPSSPLDVRRTALVRAMAGIDLRSNGTTGDSASSEYHTNITNAVVSLAKFWKPSLETSMEESLRNRTQRVLEGQDPVLALLNERMKACFVQLLVSDRPHQNHVAAPSQLRSGMMGGTNPALSDKAKFLQSAYEVFCAKGMTFFASDLARTAWMAHRIIELAIWLYDEAMFVPVLR